jgi:tetratricopeptide (TPR) repeat protein
MSPRIAVCLLALVALVLAGCAGDGFKTQAQVEAEDAEARVGYYEESAKTYYDGGRYQNAALMWQRVLEERPDDQWAKLGLAKSLQMQGGVRQLRQAEAILTDILPLDWSHPTRGDVRFEVLTSLATVYSDLADFYDRDVRLIDNQLRSDPNADATTLNQQLARQKQMRDGLLRQSIPLFREALQTSPDNPYALAGLAKAHLVAGNEDLGVQFAQRYIDLSQRSQVNWRRLLDEWTGGSQGQVSREGRSVLLGKIRGAREKELGMRMLLAAVFMRREQFAESIKQYDAVLEMDPATPAALLERGQAYAALALYPNAVADLEAYLKMTDPQRDRLPRLSAADLLDRYRRLAGDQPLFPTSATTRTPGRGPAPVRAPQPPPSPADAWGSPDG